MIVLSYLGVLNSMIFLLVCLGLVKTSAAANHAEKGVIEIIMSPFVEVE